MNLRNYATVHFLINAKMSINSQNLSGSYGGSGVKLYKAEAVEMHV